MQEEDGMGIYKPRRDASEETNPFLKFLPAELQENKFLLCMPLSLWYFVIASERLRIAMEGNMFPGSGD